MRKLTAEKRKESRGVRVSLDKTQMAFVYDHTTPDERAALWLDQAKRNAAQAASQEAFYAEYRRLTHDLSNANKLALTMSVPMACNADSTDVEVFIVEHFRQPVTDNNCGDVAEAFRKWFREVSPGEYATAKTAMFRRW